MKAEEISGEIVFHLETDECGYDSQTKTFFYEIPKKILLKYHNRFTEPMWVMLKSSNTNNVIPVFIDQGISILSKSQYYSGKTRKIGISDNFSIELIFIKINTISQQDGLESETEKIDRFFGKVILSLLGVLGIVIFVYLGVWIRHFIL